MKRTLPYLTAALLAGCGVSDTPPPVPQPMREVAEVPCKNLVIPLPGKLKETSFPDDFVITGYKSSGDGGSNNGYFTSSDGRNGHYLFALLYQRSLEGDLPGGPYPGGVGLKGTSFNERGMVLTFERNIVLADVAFYFSFIDKKQRAKYECLSRVMYNDYKPQNVSGDRCEPQSDLTFLRCDWSPGL